MIGRTERDRLRERDGGEGEKGRERKKERTKEEKTIEVNFACCWNKDKILNIPIIRTVYSYYPELRSVCSHFSFF